MFIDKALIVLGKRLKNDRLTPEGLSRVKALIGYLKREYRHITRSSNHRSDVVELPVIVFCGGVTEGNTVSEAEVMYQAFLALCLEEKLRVDQSRIVLEQQSTSTVENIIHVAQELVNSGLCSIDHALDIVFVSNDYHLQRIFEIQHYMDEQGLLRTLKQRCLAHGLVLNIEQDIAHHIVVPYPHHCFQGNLFILLDELTTYRVYLEGTKARNFSRPLDEVRRQPYRLAQAALERIQTCLSQPPSGYTLQTDIPSQAQQVPLKVNLAQLALEFVEIHDLIESTPPECSLEEVTQAAVRLNEKLVQLNRRLDPEQNPWYPK